MSSEDAVVWMLAGFAIGIGTTDKVNTTILMY